MSGENYAGVFGKMDFPAYAFKPYPKQVGKDARGVPVIVHSKEEEEAFLAAPPETVKPNAESELARAKFENEQLKARLDALEAAQNKAAAAKAAAPLAKVDVLAANPLGKGK